MAIFYKLLPLIAVILAAVPANKFLFPLWYKFKIKKIMRFRPGISVTDTSGFTIHEKDNAVKKFRWQDIHKIDLAGKEKLKIYFIDSTTLSLWDRDYTGWLSLVKAAPPSMPVNDAFATFKDEHFSNLACCKVCGKIAVKKDECLNCVADTYEKYCRDAASYEEKVQTEREFLRENQLDWFSSYVDEGKVEFYQKDVLYDNCPGWSPSVTAAEVIKYEKEMDN